jgi:hypothetical protein
LDSLVNVDVDKDVNTSWLERHAIQNAHITNANKWNWFVMKRQFNNVYNHMFHSKNMVLELQSFINLAETKWRSSNVHA